MNRPKPPAKRTPPSVEELGEDGEPLPKKPAPKKFVFKVDEFIAEFKKRLPKVEVVRHGEDEEGRQWSCNMMVNTFRSYEKIIVEMDLSEWPADTAEGTLHVMFRDSEQYPCLYYTYEPAPSQQSRVIPLPRIVDAIKQKWPIGLQIVVFGESDRDPAHWPSNYRLGKYTKIEAIVKHFDKDVIKDCNGTLEIGLYELDLDESCLSYKFIKDLVKTYAPTTVRHHDSAVMAAPAGGPKKQIYMALDIEKGGNTYDHPLLAVGICIGDLEKGTLKKRTWCCRQKPGQEFELRCIYEFWYKYPLILKRIDEESLPLDDQMHAFAQFLYDIDKEYPEDQYTITLLSDNPSFDIEHLDYYLCTITKTLPVRYSRNNKYRSVDDPSERLSALDMWTVESEVLKNVVNHDHYPENDAEKIFFQHVLALAASNMLKKEGTTLKDVKKKLLLDFTDDPAIIRGTLLRMARGDA